MKKGIGLYVIIILVAIVVYFLFIKKSNAIATTPPTGTIAPGEPIPGVNKVVTFIEGLFKK
jgi:hypothetical protein